MRYNTTTRQHTLYSGCWQQWGNTRGIDSQNKLRWRQHRTTVDTQVHRHTRIRVGSIKVSSEDNIKNDCQRDGSNLEGPRDKAMALCSADYRVEDGPDEETHDETTNMGWTRSGLILMNRVSNLKHKPKLSTSTHRNLVDHHRQKKKKKVGLTRNVANGDTN